MIVNHQYHGPWDSHGERPAHLAERKDSMTKRFVAAVCLAASVLFPLFLSAQTIKPITKEIVYSASYPEKAKGSEKMTFDGKDGIYSRGELGDPDFVAAEIRGTTFGDLNGDHVADGVVEMGIGAGGSGSATTIYAVIATKGDPIVTNPFVLGDRVAVKSVTIRSQKIVLNVLKHGPNDGSCCPRVKTSLTLVVKNGRLLGPKFRDWQ